MRYESEILYDLMKRDGLLNPSQDNLPYEDELKEKYVDEVKGAYPKVTDYRPEWMNYNLGYYIPADFPTESLVNVTSGTVNNVVPYAYKSAILSGQTLVNIANYSDATVNINNKYVQIGSLVYSVIGKPITLFNFTDKVITFQLIANGSFKQTVNINANSKTVITLSDGEEIKNIRGTQTNGWTIDETSLNELKMVLMVIEGDYTNVDIPYFEGMTSVKAPVLRTVGKNLVDKESLNGKTSNGIKFSVSNKVIKLDGVATSTFGNVEIANYLEKNNTYTYSVYENGKLATSGYRLWVRYSDDTISNPLTTATFTTKNLDIKKVEFVFEGVIVGEATHKEITIQIEKGSKLTPYEPFKSNILTVNEDVTLRGIGDVQDELNTQTGEVTEHIAEITLNGSQNEKWSLQSINSNNIANFRCFIEFKERGKTLCDKFIKQSTVIAETTSPGYLMENTNTLYIRVLSTTANNVESFRNYLASNPVTIQYEITTPVIKTVDLNIVNQDGIESTFRPFEGTMNLRTDGTPIKPTFSGEIPVEAITQNLASFVNLEGVERNE